MRSEKKVNKRNGRNIRDYIEEKSNAEENKQQKEVD